MKKLVIGALLLVSNVLFAGDTITYSNCNNGLDTTTEIKAIKEIYYNKRSKRLEIIKSDKLVTKALVSLGGLRHSNYVLSGDLQGVINNKYHKGLRVYKLSLDETSDNDKVRLNYGQDLDVTMYISISKVNEDKITLTRGVGYNLYFNHGNMRSLLDEDMIKETNGGSVRVLEEIWRVPETSGAYTTYLKSLNKGSLTNGELDGQTNKIHIEKALDYETSVFSCKRKI